MTPESVARLAREVADPTQDLVILAEGNVSLSFSDLTLWIKGSGRAMAHAAASDFCEVRLRPLVDAVDGDSWDGLDDVAIRERLDATRLDPDAVRPSTETFMHAWLMKHSGWKCVVHTHPTAVLSLLIREDAALWATRRFFPDEIVLTGPATAWVSYVAPGLPLAKAIREAALRFGAAIGEPPKTYWLQNHGLITGGKTPAEALSATLMAVKSARMLRDALASGAELRWMSDAEIAHIAGWPDEHFRQSALWNDPA